MFAAATKYEIVVESIRKRVPAATLGSCNYRELVRLATLAASSHNTQPWKFQISEGCVQIFPDYERRCPVVDPDDAHLFKSLGCAAENLIHAAAAQGLAAREVRYDKANDCVVIPLQPDSELRETDLSRAITQRQCTKAPFNGNPLGSDHLHVLRYAAQGNGVRVIMLTSNEQKETVIEFVNKGNIDQFSSHSFRRELKEWIRSNPRESLLSGDGLAGITAGKPSLPSWLARHVINWFITAKSQCRDDAENIRSSAGVAVFVSEDDCKSAWVETGRCFERFALKATALKVRTAFMNQPIEVSELRSSFEHWLGLENEHAQLIVRFGYGPQMPFSVRRPIDDVVVGPVPCLRKSE